jgi:hypothetical protein
MGESRSMYCHRASRYAERVGIGGGTGSGLENTEELAAFALDPPLPPLLKGGNERVRTARKRNRNFGARYFEPRT